MIRSLAMIAFILYFINLQTVGQMDEFLAVVYASCPETLMECPK